jgi:hypothetical protein
MQKTIYGVLILCLTLIGNVKASKKTSANHPYQPIKVEVIKTEKGFKLLRGGKVYYIKGAGASSYYDRVAAYGGNSIRTWGTNDASNVLQSAQKNGLTVMMGLPVMPERHGFNYDDVTAVKKQFEKIKAEVLKYKDHPALLTWGIGNELNLSYKNPKVWQAVNDIAKMIHDVDPNHPATTVLAGINQKEINEIKATAPELDIIAINTYGGLSELPAKIKSVGWNGPYLVTEWGPTGHWESLQTEWNAPVEETSSEKAAVYQNRYNYGIDRDKANCLGSYVFLWGQKQERTPTWYGIFTAKGEESEVVDVIQYLWTSTFPKNRAPHIFGFLLNKQKSNQSIYLKPNTTYEARVMSTDPDKDTLKYRWELLPEATNVGEGGDHEYMPEVLNLNAKEIEDGVISLITPKTAGAYRLFVYVEDGKNKVATANIPFFVK